jgi:hypothetical protein
MGLLYGREGRLAALFGGFRPGQEFRRQFGVQVQHEDDLDSPSSAGCNGVPFAYRSLGPVIRAVCWTGIFANASQCLGAQLAALSPAAKVRKTPSWPRSWANFSLF